MPRIPAVNAELLQPLWILREALSGRALSRKAMICTTDVEKCIRCVLVKGVRKGPHF